MSRPGSPRFAAAALFVLLGGAPDIVAEEVTAGVPDADGAPSLSAEEEQAQTMRLVRTAFERTLIDRGGLLLPPFGLQVEPGLSYMHASSDNIVIDGFTIFPVLVVGDIVSERIRRDSVMLAISARMGLPWDSQIELRLPYGYEGRWAYAADSEERNTHASGLGDVQLSLSRQLLRSRGRAPDLLGSLRWKSTTGRDPFELEDAEEIALGTGFHSLETSVTGVKATDPVVFFGGLSYSHTLSARKPVGVIRPGASYGLQLGMAMAINLDTSIRFGYDQRLTRRTRVEGSNLAGSYLTTATFSTGVSYAISERYSVDVGIGIGLTRDSPDVLLDISFPIQFY